MALQVGVGFRTGVGAPVADRLIANPVAHGHTWAAFASDPILDQPSAELTIFVLANHWKDDVVLFLTS